MAKSADAFRTISEVADWLGVPAHVLRFWESKFTPIKPVKRAGGRRYYRPDDMRLLGGIKKLLHDDGMTIKGVQKLLRDRGVQHVADLSPPLEEELADALSGTPGPAAAQPAAAPAAPRPKATVVAFQPVGDRGEAPARTPPSDPGEQPPPGAAPDAPAAEAAESDDGEHGGAMPVMPSFGRHRKAGATPQTRVPGDAAAGPAPTGLAAEPPATDPPATEPPAVNPPAPAGRKPANPTLPPDPDDDIPAPAGALSVAATLPALPGPQAAQALARLRARLIAAVGDRSDSARGQG